LKLGAIRRAHRVALQARKMCEKAALSFMLMVLLKPQTFHYLIVLWSVKNEEHYCP